MSNDRAHWFHINHIPCIFNDKRTTESVKYCLFSLICAAENCVSPLFAAHWAPMGFWQNIFPPEFKIALFLGWINSQNVEMFYMSLSFQNCVSPLFSPHWTPMGFWSLWQVADPLPFESNQPKLFLFLLPILIFLAKFVSKKIVFFNFFCGTLILVTLTGGRVSSIRI